ncbi:MAG: hypothetical protein A3E57_03800 [Candidatus Muproteobacteria bacterium RIFCSPHIGHO2_12_FULL_60_33]|nr:MAG: hypothetical protein A2W42_01625 [Candidatus Muproteobacteria bacterium RIFCSPHIGHO2_01_60_12]OGI56123.1 MAG: hypothetical protein A3E57_03800 [Candidatus Muproteobacteria bacterium RIFCSPHIGHO2_12_FULL_60_33]
MNLEIAIRESEELIQWLDKNIDGIEIKSNDRSRIAAGCLDMALEHQKAIVLLTSHRLYGSAAALVRLVFESYVRGVWFFYSASGKELQEFKNDKLGKTFDELIKDIEKHEAFSEGILSDVKKLSWKVMNSFTHGGFYQVVRRNKETEISPNYSDEEIIDALESANSFAILTAIAIADMANNVTLANSIYERGMEFFKKNPSKAIKSAVGKGD